MRVISGSARGLKLITPDGLGTRPTTDRVKESVFNIIQTHIPCTKVLDLFSGSGALGIEALSRGCKSCTFVDFDSTSFEIIQKNLEKSRLSEKAVLHKKDAIQFLAGCKEKFDLIFLDPPYNKGFLSKVFELIDKNSVLQDYGIIVVETEYGGELPSNENFECIKSAKYGKTAILIYKLKKNEGQI